MKNKGWQHERYRHALAQKGVKTKHGTHSHRLSRVLASGKTEFTSETRIMMETEKESGTIYVTVFGGLPRFHRDGNLLRNHHQSKVFEPYQKKEAKKYYERLKSAETEFEEKHPEGE